MKIANVVDVEWTGNTLKVILVSPEGTRRTAYIHRHAQSALLEALLAGTPAEVGQSQPRGPFVVQGVRLSQGVGSIFVLEAFLTPKTSVQLALPLTVQEPLRELLGQNPSKWRSTMLS